MPFGEGTLLLEEMRSRGRPGQGVEAGRTIAMTFPPPRLAVPLSMTLVAVLALLSLRRGGGKSAGLPLFLWGWMRNGLAALAPRRLWSEEPPRLVATWALGAFLAFSLTSGEQVHYLLEMPALALLLSGMALPRRSPHWARLLPIFTAAAVVALVVAVALGLVPDVLANGGSPAWPGSLAAAMILLGLLATALCLPKASPGLLAAPLTFLAFLAAASPMLLVGYDAGPLGRLPRRKEPQGRTLHGKDHRLYRVPETPS